MKMTLKHNGVNFELEFENVGEACSFIDTFVSNNVKTESIGLNLDNNELEIKDDEIEVEDEVENEIEDEVKDDVEVNNEDEVDDEDDDTDLDMDEIREDFEHAVNVTSVLLGVDKTDPKFQNAVKEVAKLIGLDNDN